MQDGTEWTNYTTINPTKTTVRRSLVRPELQLSVLPEGWPPGPQHARNGPEEKQKSRAKLVGRCSRWKINSNEGQYIHTYKQAQRKIGNL